MRERDNSGIPLITPSSMTSINMGEVPQYTDEDIHATYGTLGVNIAAKNDAASGASGLGTYDGVFVPCLLSIFGVILFERLTWVLGMAGLTMTCVIMLLSYTVVTLTTLSISAIATNGEMGGGGAYYMISRSLGPEFGGSIGIVFYFANVVGAALYIYGFTDALKIAVGDYLGLAFPEDTSFNILCGSVTLVVLTVVCLIGASFYAKTSLFIFAVLSVSLITLITSLVFQSEGNVDGYTGFNGTTLSDNVAIDWSNSSNASDEPQSFNTLFSIFFPAVTGIMAGANMSGDLQSPAKSIPSGTLKAVATSAVFYYGIVILVAFTFTRETIQQNYLVTMDVSFFWPIIAVGIAASTLSSALGAIIGASRILQAIAKDELIPGLKVIGKGFGENEEPLRAVMFTWLLIQTAVAVGQLNLLASIVTMFFLLSYSIVNFACFTLSVTGAPNFRPLFKYYHRYLSLLGAVLCTVTMFYVAFTYASMALFIFLVFFLYIHYMSPTHNWGEVTQAIIYHQVRKYLLRLDTRKEHVKYWRPQLLLLVDNPRANMQLIDFCNTLKKGGLYVIGHVLTGDMRTHGGMQRQLSNNWLELIRVAKIKAFAEVTTSPSFRIGVQSLLMTSGLGGMKPNTMVVGFYTGTRGEVASDSIAPLSSKEQVAVHRCLDEFPDLRVQAEQNPLSLADYCELLKDSIVYEKHLLIARHFHKLNKDGLRSDFKDQSQLLNARRTTKIDLWLANPMGEQIDSSTTLILMLGHIVSRKDIYSKAAKLRVLTYVTDPSLVETERAFLEKILYSCRIAAEIAVIPLNHSQLALYNKDLLNRDREADDPFKTSRFPVVNDIMRHWSADSALLFVPLPNIPDEPADYAKFQANITALTDNLPPVLLVKGAHSVISTDL